jgi:hypothetical protein
MKGLKWALMVLVSVGLVVVFAVPAAAADYNYVGAKGCSMCHKAEAKGAQYTQWQGTKHAHAYETLASAEAKEVGAAKGIDDPQKSPECLKCHVTGYGLDASRFEPTYSQEEGVGCESCHGPGAAYKKITIMKDIEQAKASGLIIPNEETCKQCHNEESPTFKPFNYAERYAEIAHPRPKTGE